MSVESPIYKQKAYQLEGGGNLGNTPSEGISFGISGKLKFFHSGSTGVLEIIVIGHLCKNLVAFPADGSGAGDGDGGNGNGAEGDGEGEGKGDKEEDSGVLFGVGDGLGLGWIG